MAKIDDAHAHVDEIWGAGRTLKQRAVAFHALLVLMRDGLHTSTAMREGLLAEVELLEYTFDVLLVLIDDALARRNAAP
jgi:hypothetical protein